MSTCSPAQGGRLYLSLWAESTAAATLGSQDISKQPSVHTPYMPQYIGRQASKYTRAQGNTRDSCRGGGGPTMGPPADME